MGVAADAGDSVGAEFAPDVTGLVDDEVINITESGGRDAAYIEAVFGGAHPADFVAGGVEPAFGGGRDVADACVDDAAGDGAPARAGVFADAVVF